jgi:uncharacterized membrane protein YbhN (UPF0104 family)
VSTALAGTPAPRFRLTHLAAWSITAGLAALALWRIDFARLAAALRGASLAPLGLALAINVIANSLARVRRWQALLQPLPHGPRPAHFVDLFRLLFAGYALSNLLPARPGEALRVVELHRRRGYPVSGLVAVQLAEKIVETLSLGLLCGAAALLASPGSPGRAPLASGGALAVLGVALLLALPRRVPQAERGFLRGLLGAAQTLHARRSWIRSAAWSLLSDTTDLVLVGLCLRAVGIEVPPCAWALVLFTINLAILLPSTPGQVGVLEAGGVLALSIAGVAPAPALAFALLYHSIHLVPTTALGLFGMCLPWRQP